MAWTVVAWLLAQLDRSASNAIQATALVSLPAANGLSLFALSQRVRHVSMGQMSVVPWLCCASQSASSLFKGFWVVQILDYFNQMGIQILEVYDYFSIWCLDKISVKIHCRTGYCNCLRKEVWLIWFCDISTYILRQEKQKTRMSGVLKCPYYANFESPTLGLHASKI